MLEILQLLHHIILVKEMTALNPFMIVKPLAFVQNLFQNGGIHRHLLRARNAIVSFAIGAWERFFTNGGRMWEMRW